MFLQLKNPQVCDIIKFNMSFCVQMKKFQKASYTEVFDYE